MRSTLIYGVGASVLLVGSAHGLASEITWQGGGTPSPTTFNEGDNWVGNAAPADSFTTSGDVAVLPGTVTEHQPTVTVSQGLKGIRFDGSGWTLGGAGQTLTVRAAGQPNGVGIVTTNASGTNTINANVAIGTMDSPATGFNVATGGTLAIFGDLSRTSLLAGSGGPVIKDGGGVLELNGGGSTNIIVNKGTVKVMAGTGGLSSNMGLEVKSTGIYDAYGTNVSLQQLKMSSGSTLTSSSATLRTITTNPYAVVTLKGLISGNLSMNYGGPGTTIGSGNTYTGGTTISNGTLLVNNGTGSGTGSGAVAVLAGTFGGTGSISGALTIGNGSGTDDATLSPGSSVTPVTLIGTLGVGALTFKSDGKFAAQFDSSLLTSDLVDAIGSISLGNGLALLQLSDLGNAVVAPNTVFTLLQSTTSISGYFRDLAPVGGIGPDVTVGLNTYRLDYNPTSVTLTVVPEPSMLGLLSLAGVGMIRRRRRQL